ncbi:MAG: DUF3782 domain-containing protein [Thermoanaerobaculia bacterium]
MTNVELREFITNLAIRQAETARQIKESQAETDRQIKELGRQIGGLGEKFGGFTEGMAFPSMQKILEQRFGMDVVSVRAIGIKKDRSLEIDVLAYSKSHVFAVEVKSHLREDGVQQMLRILNEFHDFFPGHEGKKVFGILAAVDAPKEVQKRVLKEGIYLAIVHDDNFEIRVPDGFQPRAF